MARQLGKNEFQRALEQESLILAATESLCELMDQRAVTKAELARRIGKSRGFVTQILSGNRNMTLRTLADLAFALGSKVDVTMEAIESTGAQPEVVFDPFEEDSVVQAAYESFVRNFEVSRPTDPARTLQDMMLAYSWHKSALADSLIGLSEAEPAPDSVDSMDGAAA